MVRLWRAYLLRNLRRSRCYLSGPVAPVERLQYGFRLTRVLAVGMHAARRARLRRSPSNDCTGFGSLGIEFNCSNFCSSKQMPLPDDSLVRLRPCSSATKVSIPGSRRAYREFQRKPARPEANACYPTPRFPLQQSFPKIAQTQPPELETATNMPLWYKDIQFPYLTPVRTRFGPQTLVLCFQPRLLSAPKDPYLGATQHSRFCLVPP
ncbi:hypothetical protein, variant 1 [Cladophialophora immunda]|uniref:Uncharacterized protein n=1 Tax=Cladophialophora immunda TaxID=569365 RepID=A0A0D2CU63_9EURO|nr:hypothetical protein, variant 1 [Cladophialophora immunda]KIW34698.1 hypothetical protein, variant 1 [Cladophialophora immunda]